tara:strand:+ start:148 stop:663 length:516 start_codon:yes stop_codon:yes gene_type:complete
MNKILCILVLCLLNKNTLCEDSNSFDDDDDYINNANININLYKTYNNCITNNNSLYNLKTSFEFECECISKDRCLNNLLNSSKFNTLNLKYNNTNIYLNKLNFTKQCQKYENYYIFHDIEIYTFCGTYIVIYVFLILLFIISVISFINHKYGTKKKYTKINEVPPNYDAVN